MSDPLHILILAAGLGTRLRPLTNRVPKPLVPVVDLTILEHQLRRIDLLKKKLPVESVSINAHHLHEQIVEVARKLQIDHVFVEQPDILGTGGPLYRAWNAGLRGEILVVNSDSFHQFDLADFVLQVRESEEDSALLCVDFQEINSLAVDVSGRVCGVRGNYLDGHPVRYYTFSGIAWYNASAWARVREDDFSIVEFWRRESSEKRYPLAYTAQSNALWIDMGSPQGLYQANLARLLELGLDRYIHPGAQVDPECIREGAVICDRVIVEYGASVSHSLVLPGARVVSGISIQQMILGEDFHWSLIPEKTR